MVDRNNPLQRWTTFLVFAASQVSSDHFLQPVAACMRVLACALGCLPTTCGCVRREFFSQQLLHPGQANSRMCWGCEKCLRLQVSTFDATTVLFIGQQRASATTACPDHNRPDRLTGQPSRTHYAVKDVRRSL